MSLAALKRMKKNADSVRRIGKLRVNIINHCSGLCLMEGVIMRKTVHFLLVSCLFTGLIIPSHVFSDTRGIKVQVKVPEGRTINLYGDSYALVVGNGNYKKGWDPLPGAIRDVKEVADVLEKKGFKVTLKIDLTKDAFNKVFGEFSLRYGRHKDNRLLFYYAGHGYTQKMATGEDLGYLVMVDAPVPEKDPVGFDLKSVDMVSVVTQAKKIRARHVLFMFDSCFSGSILNLRDRVVPQSISENIRHPVRQFITAGRANEPVPDSSVFKQAFLDLLEGRDREPIPDGYITGEELGLYLKNKVPEYNPSQHPQYGKIRDPRLDKGDFVFIAGAGYPSQAPVDDTLLDEEQALEEQLKRLQAETEEAEARAKRLEAKRKLEELQREIEEARRKKEEAERKAQELEQKAEVASLRARTIDLGLVHYSQAPKTFDVELPDHFSRVEIGVNHKGKKPPNSYCGWRAWLEVNDRLVWKFKRWNKREGGVFADYTRGGREVREVTGKNKYLDVTSFFKPGMNKVTYYHYNEGSGIVVKVRVY